MDGTVRGRRRHDVAGERCQQTAARRTTDGHDVRRTDAEPDDVQVEQHG